MDSRLIEWSIFIGGILLLIYTMIVIGEEKNSFLESAVKVKLKNISFLIPSWWKKAEGKSDHNNLFFERTDTDRDWFAHYEFHNDSPKNKSTAEMLVEKIQDRSILLDEGSDFLINPSTIFNNSNHLTVENYEIARVEGMGTKDEIDRIYIDAAVIRSIKTGVWIFCESRSSILNGSLEGPYFEESLCHIKMD